METLGDLRSRKPLLTCTFGWSSAVTRLLATLQCESIEHMSSLERENRRRIGVPERTTVLKRVFSTRNRTEIPIPASICCSDALILRYSRNQRLLTATVPQTATLRVGRHGHSTLRFLIRVARALCFSCTPPSTKRTIGPR